MILAIWKEAAALSTLPPLLLAMEVTNATRQWNTSHRVTASVEDILEAITIKRVGDPKSLIFTFRHPIFMELELATAMI